MNRTCSAKRLLERRASSVIIEVLFFVLGSAAVWAQGISTAQIVGTVTDQSGAVLPGVEVSVMQVDTGLRRSILTDERGSYVLTNLPVGRLPGAATERGIDQ